MTVAGKPKHATAGPGSPLEILAPIAQEMTHTEQRVGELLQSDIPFVRDLTAHIERFRGKRLRPAVLHFAVRAVGGTPNDVTVSAAASVEMMHLATLVHDDVIDGTALRRRQATVHLAWDSRTAVLLGDYLFSRAVDAVAHLDDRRPFETVSAASRVVCEGELLQQAALRDGAFTEVEYFSIVEKKTAALFRTAGYLGAHLGGGGEEEAAALAHFGAHVGVAFQIVDDIFDLVGREDVVGKSVRADLHGGVQTLPVIHFMAHAGHPERGVVADALAGAGARIDRDTLVELLTATGSLDHAWQAVRDELDEAERALSLLPETRARAGLFRVAGYIAARKW